MQYGDGTTTYGDAGFDGGQIYCNQEQWEDFDYQTFEELYTFAQKKEYSPLLSQKNNKDVVRFRVDGFDEFYDNELTIYKESIDGLFTSIRANHYQIIEGRLYLVIHYNYGYGEYHELECVPVPEEFSDYVIQKVSNLLE